MFSLFQAAQQHFNALKKTKASLRTAAADGDDDADGE